VYIALNLQLLYSTLKAEFTPGTPFINKNMSKTRPRLVQDMILDNMSTSVVPLIVTNRRNIGIG
jgi:hypothetical protein